MFQFINKETLHQCGEMFKVNIYDITPCLLTSPSVFIVDFEQFL